MKRNNNNHNIHASSVNDMPDIEIVDLENDTMQDTDSDNFHSGNTRSGSVHNFHTDSDDDIEDLYVDADEEIPEGEESVAPAGIRRFLNFHVLFALVLLIVVGVVGYRVTHWGQRISQSDIFKDGQGSYDDSWDSILPLTDENGQMIINDASNIVVFGNAPFADDRDSSDNLANLIAKETDTTVYNCSISGSYLAAQQLNYDPTVAPMDAYCLYWLVNLAVGVPLDGYYTDAANALGDKTPAEAEEVINTLKTLDFNTIDTVAIMYDATDYLSGNAMYSDENPTDPTQFTGNLEASIEVLQNYYPQIRIIVMSPTYAYAVDENGEKVEAEVVEDKNEDSAEEEKKDKTIYYVTDEKQQSQYINMFKAAKMDAVMLTDRIDQPFISQLEAKNEGIHFARIDADLTDAFKAKTSKKTQEELNAQAEKVEKLVQKALKNDKIKVKIEKLKNKKVSSVLTVSEESRRMQDMMKMYGGGMDMSMFGAEGETLVLNANHPLVTYITEHEDDANTEMICEQLYDLAKLQNAPLSPEAMTKFVARSNDIMLLLAKQ